ncbi:unnamed protein product [Sphagnum jensenii]|uniref:F-box domain-containing protein n=1 Tax=Sphagnum jensenii TaxID=128206 RepID=A0ABP0VNI9_9BRYO
MDHLPQHCVEMIVQKVAWSEDVIDAAVSLARLSCVSRSLHDAIMDSEGWKASVQLHFGVNFSTSKRAAAMFKQCAAQAWIYCCLPNPQAETLEQKAHILASRHA